MRVELLPQNQVRVTFGHGRELETKWEGLGNCVLAYDKNVAWNKEEGRDGPPFNTVPILAEIDGIPYELVPLFACSQGLCRHYSTNRDDCPVHRTAVTLPSVSDADLDALCADIDLSDFDIKSPGGT